MEAPIIALICLFAGPLVAHFGLQRGSRVHSVLEYLLQSVIVSAVLIFWLPDAIGAIGLIAIPALLLGTAIPYFAKRPALSGRWSAAAIIAIAGHEFLEGAALPIGPSAGVVWALALHRFPIGLAVWWQVGRRNSTVVATAWILFVGAGFLAGYFLALFAAPNFAITPTTLYQCVVFGWLLEPTLRLFVNWSRRIPVFQK